MNNTLFGLQRTTTSSASDRDLYSINTNTGYATFIYNFAGDRSGSTEGYWRDLYSFHGDLYMLYYSYDEDSYSRRGATLYKLLHESISPYTLPSSGSITQTTLSLGSSSSQTTLPSAIIDAPGPYFVNTSSLIDCDPSSVIGIDTPHNSSTDVTGDFAVNPCFLNSDNDDTTEDDFYGDDDKSPAHVYRIQFSTQRDVNITFSPNTTIEDAGYGEYALRIRRASFDGEYVTDAEANGLGTLTLENVSMAGTVDFYVEVLRYGFGGNGAYSLSFQYGYIQPPTPTPIPSPTPVPQPNTDTRIDPEPNSKRYMNQNVYQFAVAGNSDFFPVRVRAGNADAVKLSRTATTLDCTIASSELSNMAEGTTFYTHICDKGTNSTLRVYRESSNTETAQYSMIISGDLLTIGGANPTPGPSVGPQFEYGFGQRPDAIGITLATKEVCGAAGISCNVNLIKDALGLIMAVGVFLGIAAVGKGQSTFLYGIGFALAIVTLLLGYLLIGLPLWYALTGILIISVATGLGVVVKMKRAV